MWPNGKALLSGSCLAKIEGKLVIKSDRVHILGSNCSQGSSPFTNEFKIYLVVLLRGPCILIYTRTFVLPLSR